MRSVVLHCPWLDRDISLLHEQIPNLEIFVGEWTPRGEDGCLQSHLEIVAETKAEGLDRVFVVEDDCEFTRHFSFERWCQDAEWAKTNGYDIMIGGSTRTYDERVVRDGMIEVQAFHSAHCIVYFESSFDKVQNAVQPYDYSLGNPPTNPIMGTERHTGCRIVLVYPFVAIQKPSFSGILREPVDYVPLYGKHEQELGHRLRMR